VVRDMVTQAFRRWLGGEDDPKKGRCGIERKVNTGG